MNPTLANFQHDMHGPGGILAGIREAAAKPGTLARFLVRTHPAHQHKHPDRQPQVVEVGLSEIDGRPTWRHAVAGDLLGEGSNALIPSWYDDQTVEAAAATLSYQLARSCQPDDVVFRLVEGGAA